MKTYYTVIRTNNGEAQTFITREIDEQFAGLYFASFTYQDNVRVNALLADNIETLRTKRKEFFEQIGTIITEGQIRY